MDHCTALAWVWHAVAGAQPVSVWFAGIKLLNGLNDCGNGCSFFTALSVPTRHRPQMSCCGWSVKVEHSVQILMIKQATTKQLQDVCYCEEKSTDAKPRACLLTEESSKARLVPLWSDVHCVWAHMLLWDINSSPGEDIHKEPQSTDFFFWATVCNSKDAASHRIRL